MKTIFSASGHVMEDHSDEVPFLDDMSELSIHDPQERDKEVSVSGKVLVDAAQLRVVLDLASEVLDTNDYDRECLRNVRDAWKYGHPTSSGDTP